jgi:hypothetical protein
MKPLLWIVGIATAIVASWWSLEMALIAISRYRLRHGDGREHAFKAPRPDPSSRS